MSKESIFVDVFIAGDVQPCDFSNSVTLSATKANKCNWIKVKILEIAHNLDPPTDHINNWSSYRALIEADVAFYAIKQAKFNEFNLYNSFYFHINNWSSDQGW